MLLICNYHYLLSHNRTNSNHGCGVAHHIWTTSSRYLVKCSTCSSDWRYRVFLQMLTTLKRGWLMLCGIGGSEEKQLVMCGNLNVRQATSQQVFKVTTFCTDTCFQSFSPLINCIVHHALLKFSPCRKKTLPQLVRIADWYSIHALQHALEVVIYRVEVTTVGWPHVRTDELRCLTAQKLDCVTSCN